MVTERLTASFSGRGSRQITTLAMVYSLQLKVSSLQITLLQSTDHTSQIAVYILQLQRKECTAHITVCILKFTSYRLKNTDYSLQAIAISLQISVHRLQFTDYRLESTDYSSQITV